MKREMIMVRIGGGLFPDGDQAWEVFNKIPQNQLVKISWLKSRNLQLLRKYWAVAAVVADHYDGYDDREDADHDARCSTPWMRKEYVAQDGVVMVRPRSIAFDEMEEEEFERFYERAIAHWAERIGTDPEQLLRETGSRERSSLPRSGSFDR